MRCSLPGARHHESIKDRTGRDAQSGLSKHKSENQLQSKLDQTFRRSDAALHRLSDLTESVIVRSGGGAIEACSRRREVRMVEQIEEFSAELEANPLGNRCPLED